MSYEELTEAECEAFAARVRRFRLEHGLSQKQLAAAMGAGWRTIVNVEMCAFRPFPKTVARFIKVEETYRRAEEMEFEGLEGLS